ncbi:metallophosphoesterase [Proteiniphilum saccharofermentans]|uniref:metallophosphoesterase n=1 Tax=Proteiniphilum saccharofermentans TaxID=1642647 RepID=UPI0028AE9AD2|nr:metallophosphoesterase [Proteiniphilum saccharofermentans]
MRALINAFIIHLTLNILVFLKGWNVFEGKKAARIIMIVIFGTEFLVYSIGFIFYRHLPEAFTQFSRVMGTSWMLFVLYSGGLWLIIDLAYVIRQRISHKPWRLREQSRRFKTISYFVPIVIVAGIMVHGRYQFMHPEVQQLPVTIHKPAGKVDSVRIAMIGDLHLGYMIDRNHTKRFVDLIMAQQPELILFVGDIIDGHIEPILQQRMDEELSRLHAPLGVFSCTGNHEYRYDAEEKIELLNNAGIIILRDSAVLIDSSFYVVGREDKVVPTRKPLKEILTGQSVEMSKPVIVLNHTPDNLAEEADAGADIALYGHTHHGQAFPGNIATEFVFEVAHGYKKKENTHIYVTSGIGLVGPQHRIGTVSEMVMLTVKFQP